MGWEWTLLGGGDCLRCQTCVGTCNLSKKSLILQNCNKKIGKFCLKGKRNLVIFYFEIAILTKQEFKNKLCVFTCTACFMRRTSCYGLHLSPFFNFLLDMFAYIPLCYITCLSVCLLTRNSRCSWLLKPSIAFLVQNGSY